MQSSRLLHYPFVLISQKCHLSEEVHFTTLDFGRIRIWGATSKHVLYKPYKLMGEKPWPCCEPRALVALMKEYTMQFTHVWHTHAYIRVYNHMGSAKNGGDVPEDPEAANVEPEKVTNLLGLRDALYSKV
jgi:hypothetical protein